MLALPEVLVGYVACRDRHAAGWSDVLRMLLPLLLVMALVHELRWWAAGQWCMVAAEMHGRCDRLCYLFWFVLLVAWQSSHILCASLWPAGQLVMLVFLWLVLVLMLALPEVLVGYVACRDRHAAGWSDVLRMLLPLLLVMALVHELRWWAAAQWCMVAAEMPGQCHCLCLFWFVLLMAWLRVRSLCYLHRPACQVSPCLMWQHP